MAAKSSTPSFILELPVKTDDSQARILQKRFEAARQIYNACLGESMRRLNLIRQSKTYQKARKMPKGKEHSQLFRDLNLRFDFSEYSLWHTQQNCVHLKRSRKYNLDKLKRCGSKGKTNSILWKANPTNAVYDSSMVGLVTVKKIKTRAWLYRWHRWSRCPSRHWTACQILPAG